LLQRTHSVASNTYLQGGKMAITKAKPAAAAVLTITALLGLAACSDPGATAATAPTSGSSTTAAGKTFNLSPQQDRFKVSVDPAAAALVP
jgi:polar amino acid transport system substrate-binding protein